MSRSSQIEPAVKKAAVAGELGVIGRTIVNHLVGLGDGEVNEISRRSLSFPTSA